MDIRPVTVGDAENLRAIYNAEVLDSTVTFDIVPRTVAEQVAWITHHQGAHPAVVAADGPAIAGFGSLSAYKERAAYSTTVEDSVYVHRDWRRRGVGKLLLEELVALATGHGFHSVMARVADHNVASVDLHRACGFEVVGTEREVGRKFGRWLDVTLLQRIL